MNDLLDEILSLLQTEMAATDVKTYGIGFKTQFTAEKSLPAIYVNPLATIVNTATTKKDQNAISVQIGVIVNQKDTSSPSTSTKNAALQQAYDLMEKIDSNGQYEQETVLYTVRKHFTANDSVYYITNISITYEPPEGDFPYYTVVCQLTGIMRRNFKNI